MGRILLLWSVLLVLVAAPPVGRAADRSTFLIGQGQRQTDGKDAPPQQSSPDQSRLMTRGTIEKIDPIAKTLTTGGKNFVLDSMSKIMTDRVKGADFSSFKKGDTVVVIYRDQNGVNTVTIVDKLTNSGSSRTSSQPTQTIPQTPQPDPQPTSNRPPDRKSTATGVTVSGMIENLDFIGETFHVNDRNFTLDSKGRVLVDGTEKSLAALREGDTITVTYLEQLGVNTATLVSKGSSPGSSVSHSVIGKAYTPTPTEVAREQQVQTEDQKLTTISGTIENIDTAMGTLNVRGESFLVSSKVEVFEGSVDGTKISLSGLKRGDPVKLICKTGDTKTVVRVIRERS